MASPTLEERLTALEAEVARLKLEERIAALEAEIARLKEEQSQSPKTPVPWWEQHFGAFKDDPDYEEAMRLGAEYRRSQRPPEEDDVSPCSLSMPGP